MDILIVGGGGREHALAWKIKQSPKAGNIFIAPGNAGTAQIGLNLLISKTEEIIDWLKENKVDLVVVGPDNYLAEGITDEIQKLGIPVFGPTKDAAEIEWSKSFAKEFMKEEGIPTAGFQRFSNFDSAFAYAKSQKFPLVIKADGLALGKGVIIANSLAEAESALQRIMKNGEFGEAGREVIIEEYLDGREISIHAFCDGETTFIFPASQDHKRIFDGDKGPNTGGMGTIAPVSWVSEKLLEEIKEKVVLPCLRGLKKRSRPFTGILYPGIIITKDGPKVVEFNARFGDPEAQVYMRILETDLLPILLSCVSGTLGKHDIKWSSKSACCVVCASGGYPGETEKGKIIERLDKIADDDVVVFHAGTKEEAGKIITNGGRVLGVTSTGENLKNALSKTYDSIKSISFDGMQYRKDIGAKSVI